MSNFSINFFCKNLDNSFFFDLYKYIKEDLKIDLRRNLLNKDEKYLIMEMK